MKRAKCVLSVLLTLCMVFGMIPCTAFAANDSMPFTDVKETDWFYEAVQYVYENGMMSGTGKTTFSPDTTTTRGMIVTILHRMEGSPTVVGETFTDAADGQYYSDAMSWASANGIVSGYGNGKFGPDNPITREQMAAILYRYAQYKGYDVSQSADLSKYTDAEQVSSYAKTAIAWANAEGLINGVTWTTLVPQGNATRAQVATILMRFCTSVAPVSYTVTFDYNYGNKGVYKTVTVESGETIDKPANPTRSGYSFEGWYAAETNGVQFDFDTVISEDITLYAKWEEKSSSGSVVVTPTPTPDPEPTPDPITTYTVTFESNGGSSVEAQTVAEGETASEPEMPTMGGFTFAGWYADAELTETYNFATPVTADITLYAAWETNTHETKITVSLRSSQIEYSVDEVGTVYFYAEVIGAVTSVILVDEATGERVLELFDDGQFSINGDDLPGDNVYSGIMTIDTSTEIAYSYYAMANDNSELISETVQIFVVGGFTDEQLSEMEIVDLTIQKDIFSAEGYAEMSLEDRISLAETVLGSLVGQNLIDEETMLYDESAFTYTFLYESGAIGAVVLKEWAIDQNGTEDRRSENIITNSATVLNSSDDNVISEGTGYVGDAIILWSFGQKWDDPYYREPFYNTLEVEFEEHGLNTTVDWDTTVEDYKNLEDYEVIVFSGHGSHTTYKVKTGLFSYDERTLSSLLLCENATSSKDKTYENDIKQFRIGKISVQGGTKYAILPNFFTYYYDSNNGNKLNGSFVFGENCEFHGKNGNVITAMAEALTAASAEAVVGFHNSVMADYSRELMETYILGLSDGATAGEALKAAKNIHGDNDYFTGREQYGPTAYPLLLGDENATLIHSGIENGDFEEASTAIHWDQVGDTRILTQLGSLLPPSNERMAILTTGIGSAEEDYLAGTEGSVISQTFRIPENSSQLAFSYDVVSEEPTEYVGSLFDDTFIVKLTVGSETYILATENINDSTWYQIDGIDFDGGDSTTYHTMWQSMNIDVSSFAGQVVTLEFIVYDVGDSIYDTAVLIDSVCLK